MGVKIMMNLEQMEEKLNESWNKSLMQIGVALLGAIFLLEILIMGIFYGGNLIEESLLTFIIRKIVLPLFVQIIIVYFMNKIYRCKSVAWIVKYKESILCYSLFVMFAFSALVYRFFHVLWIAPCVCQYLHSVYANKRGVRGIYLITNVFIVFTAYVAFKDGDYTWDYFAMTVVCVLGMMYVIYSVAKLLQEFHAEQLEYMQENFERQEELLRELKIEPMTGLYNRNAMPEKIKRIIDDNSEKPRESYMAMLDLDHFKNVNDTYGHVSGDQVIRHVATLMKKHMNADIEGFRFGGEEFTLVFRNKTKENVMSILEQIRREMSETSFSFDPKYTITISIGVAAFEIGMNEEQWVELADGALYECKRNGRNQIRMAN